MAHTKAGGSTKLGRDSAAQRLGIKKQNGESVAKGEIVVRQRGTKYIPGNHMRRAGDDTLFAMKDGKVHFYTKSKTNFDGKRRMATFVEVTQL